MSRAPNGTPWQGAGGRASRFVSRGIEGWLARHPAAQPESEDALPAELANPEAALDFDLVIIGSGYGASMAAQVFAGRRVRDEVSGGFRPARIALLERGKERLPGMFPQRFSDLAGEIRGRFPTPGPADPDNPAPAGMAEGLFDFKIDNDIGGLVANGLGGGSLINAGVMLEPREAVFSNGRWPGELADPAQLRPYYARARQLVGATLNRDSVALNTVTAAGMQPAKHQMLGRIGGEAAPLQAVPVTVQLAGSESGAMRLQPCNGCGDCASGCNWNAKRSLDVMVLAEAAARGIEVYTGVTALRFAPHPAKGWVVVATHTNPVLRRRAAAPFLIRTRQLIVAAGSYGSTELLARSRCRAQGKSFAVSERLGEQFSGNGDMIVAISDLPHPAQGVGDARRAPAARHVGPTITGALDLRDAPQGVSIQELGIPVPFRELLAQTLGLVRLTSSIVDRHAARARTSDADTRIDDAVLDHALVLAVMGDDGGAGKLTLPDETELPDIDVADGAMLVHWETKPRLSHYQGALDWLRERCRQDMPSAKVHANPVWRPLGRARTMFNADFDGPRITVHPLGGCPMGATARTGVVDHLGRVFDPAGGSDQHVHDGLAVLDGAIIPGAVGINPALTISAVSLRAAEGLAERWGFDAPAEAASDIASGGTGAGETLSNEATSGESTSSDATSSEGAGGQAAKGVTALRVAERPVFAYLDPSRAPPLPRPTLLGLSERLRGEARVMHDGHKVDVVIELTLHSSPFDARAAMPAGACIPLRAHTDFWSTQDDEPTARRAAVGSRLRVYRKDTWQRLHDPAVSLAWREQDPEGWLKVREALTDKPEQVLDGAAVLVAPVSGQIDVLHEQAAAAAWRLVRGGISWWRNVGARTIVQRIGDLWHRLVSTEHESEAKGPQPKQGSSVLQWPGIIWRFATQTVPRLSIMFMHAGRQRDMIYSLVVHTPTHAADDHWRAFAAGEARIAGRKRVRYRYGGNVLRQLMTVHLEAFPNLSRAAPLRLDLGWLARERTPLLRIVDEQSGPDGWADFAHFLGDVSRPVLLQSLFTFVAPDKPLGAAKAVSAEPSPEPGSRHGVDSLHSAESGSESAAGTPLGAEREAGGLPIGAERDAASEPLLGADTEAVRESPLGAHPVANTERPTLAERQAAAPRNAHRLAQPCADMSCEPFTIDVCEPDAANGGCTQARLMRYRDDAASARYPDAARQPPVLLIHGYSASGTTWAHPALTPGLVRCLASRGREVWALDMRTSSGMPSATHPFTFEDIAFNDLPAAITKAAEESGRGQVDVVAHCMGAVMFSMTLLAAPKGFSNTPYANLHGKVRRVVLSQAGPVMRFSAINRFRAFLMQALRFLLPVNKYQFTPQDPYALGEELIDRLLANLPYPDDSEFALENPLWGRTPYTRLRRRMDLLYGKAFSLRNLDDKVLDGIDDFFGPMSTKTLMQSIGFARHERISDVHGRPYKLEEVMADYWQSPTLWVHGAENGIFEPSSVLLAQQLFDTCGISERFQARVFEGFGHQDCLIGRQCRPVLDAMGDFLDAD